MPPRDGFTHFITVADIAAGVVEEQYLCSSEHAVGNNKLREHLP
jgi:hypothetical protein